MKKLKVTIRGLQNTIKGLNDRVEVLNKKEMEADSFDYRIRKEITDILMNGNSFNPAYRSSSYETKSWSEIKTTIARLGGMVTKEGEMNHRINHMMDAENGRLWYLMRVAMQDPLLEVPVRPDVQLDIFGNSPDKNN